ncbi:hypothetical protein ACHAQA_000917 [Verticillium albo-atrum]
MSPYDKKSIDMSLHQADVASPRRVPRELPLAQAGVGETRYYQCLRELVNGPLVIDPLRPVHELDFHVSDDDLQSLNKYSLPWGEPHVLCQYFHGSLRYRFRVCEALLDSRGMISEAEWSTLSTCWPAHIYVTFNGRAVKIRRKLHNGQDQPVELTAMIQAGQNTVKLCIPQVIAKPGHAIFVAVEKVETLGHSQVMAMVSERGAIPAESTRQIVRDRLTPAKAAGKSDGDDDVPIIFSNLSIDLADPFTSTMFETPVRGASCTHLECFDLKVWLDTRKGKPTSIHSYKCGCGQCERSKARGAEPSLTDKWKCPLCDKDARPFSLRIDGFMVEVREALVRKGLTRTKSINVGADGSWSPKAEDPDSEDEGVADAAEPQRPAKRAKTDHRPDAWAGVEVIELD